MPSFSSWWRATDWRNSAVPPDIDIIVSQNGGMCALRNMSLFAVLVSPTLGWSWLGKGHEQIADIAWAQLSSTAKSELTDILNAGDPEFRPTSTAEADVRAAFRKAATWSDWVKENTNSVFEPQLLIWNAKFQPGYDPQDSNREAHRCRRWHYFDIPIRYKGEQPGVNGANALVALTAARYELSTLSRLPIKDRASQAWWVYWITHVVGDLHQPLHCVSNHEHEESGDAGGNKFRLGVPYPDNPNRMMNLHFYWDAGIERAIQNEFPTDPGPQTVTEKWLASVTFPVEEVSNLNVADWITSGAKMAEEMVYTGVVVNGKPSEDYARAAETTSRNQAVLAGIRLARFLESALGTSKDG